MRYRKIPSAPLELTELGFGTSAIGNLYRVTPAHNAAAALAAAWDAGIRYFDTVSIPWLRRDVGYAARPS